jgi:GH25 family lysozyme M1 (1,4-beta-N-acetylmuramidase)
MADQVRTAFRAGRAKAENPEPVRGMEAVTASASAVLLADISEFQPDIADAAYLRWSRAIIIRAAYGASHDDHAWYGGDRRAQLHDGGVRFLGIYQYLIAGQDAAAQARVLARLVGSLRDGEKVICDLEEGAGNQSARWHAWRDVIRAELGDEPWLYSGLNFAAAAGLAPVDWVAAYQRSEPSGAHVLWQFTSAFAVPGAGTCDCSIFHGTIDQLAAFAHGGRPVPAPTPPSGGWTEALVNDLATLAVSDSGEDVKTAQGLLKARGFDVAVDGQYGPATRAAVTAFQHAKGIAADGVTGQDTWTKLHDR